MSTPTRPRFVMRARRWLAAPIIAALLLPACATRPAPAAREAGNVAAFARLYGVVRYFSPGDTAQTIDWQRFAIAGVAAVRGARSSAALAQSLQELIAPVAATVAIRDASERFPVVDIGPDAGNVAWVHAGMGGGAITGDDVYASWRLERLPAQDEALRKLAEQHADVASVARASGRHVEVPLGQGLHARVPLSLPAMMAASIEPAAATAALRERLAALPTPDAARADVRAADIVIAWNALRYFYPYWREVGVDWDAQLEPALAAALAKGDRERHAQALRLLVAQIADGHGYVKDTAQPRRQRLLPVAVAPAGGEWVVSASDVPDRVAVGDVVRRIGGVDATQWFAERQAATSGTPQWKAWRTASGFAAGAENTTVALDIDGVQGTRHVELTYDHDKPPTEKRPAPISELAPGVWYVDLTRAQAADLTPQLATLASARATIFDVRGYPTDAGIGILPHLIDAPEHARWMHVPIRIAPFGEPTAFAHHGWDLVPQAPHIAGKRYVLLDGRAISYAESVLGYFRDARLATTIGGASAGANGNVNAFALPGGFSVYFTGMRVTRHDGAGQLHGIGIVPDVAVTQTVAAWRDGRDLVLERALELAARDTKP